MFKYCNKKSFKNFAFLLSLILFITFNNMAIIEAKDSNQNEITELKILKERAKKIVDDIKHFLIKSQNSIEEETKNNLEAIQKALEVAIKDQNITPKKLKAILQRASDVRIQAIADYVKIYTLLPYMSEETYQDQNNKTKLQEILQELAVAIGTGDEALLSAVKKDISKIYQENLEARKKSILIETVHDYINTIDRFLSQEGIDEAQKTTLQEAKKALQNSKEATQSVQEEEVEEPS